MIRAALSLAAAILVAAPLAAAPAELPQTEDELANAVRSAIEARDYDTFERIVFWKDAGTIKKRIVAFQIRSGLGRKVKVLTVEPFDQHKLDAMLADGRHALNLPVSHVVRVVYDEPASETTGKPPTSVFLAGRKDEAFRIALVVRAFEDDDD
ncbi:hypothetical protein DLJ53_13420 [Acuticoccus sediminis]|uniref:Uncharacterized protein n=2 Tax=Acuticoccus sediminis TaxID=2184697 RepID=A0A8B2P251_9HYPH|nr:hypothetical protein [Acuticoccus sediminis]RAI02357.1 hypothetical protein DLJ53_13420 [Acuticoccus sediminis]